MKIENKFVITIYFISFIIISMILFSYIFDAVTTRLLGNQPTNTNIYYLELFFIWFILAIIMFRVKNNISQRNKTKIVSYVKSNGEDKEEEILYQEVDEMETFILLMVLGIFVIFIRPMQNNKRKNNIKDNLSMLNEDFKIISRTI